MSRSFSREKRLSTKDEVRIHAHCSCGWVNAEVGVQPEIDGEYISLRASIEKIIKRIIIAPGAPGAPGYHRDLIETILDRFELSVPVDNSILAEAPTHYFWADVANPVE